MCVFKNVFLLGGFVISVFLLTCADSKGKFYTNKNNECWVDDNSNDEYWFCGMQSCSCKSNRCAKKNTTHYLYDGATFDHNDRYFVCCGGTTSKSGIFIEITDNPDHSLYSSSSQQYTKIKQLLDGRQCSQVVRQDVCGKERVIVDCNESSVGAGCSTGTVLHNNECVTPCSSGQIFESKTSATCIDCQTTNYQGASTDTNEGDSYCVICDKATHFFDKTDRKCVLKTDSKFNTLSKSDLQYGPKGASNTSVENQCWTKTDLYNYKNCVLGKTQTLPANINRAISQTYN